jgi:hypothetical protein
MEEPAHEKKVVINRNVVQRRSGGDAVYGLGLFGALIYYVGHASGFWPVVWAIVKGILWPAFVVYDLLGHLGS